MMRLLGKFMGIMLMIFHGVFSNEEKKPLNLLFIMFDDLRPELSVYGREHMITPNFERLAAKSVVFDYSYCQVAVCNPSRDSLMTGLRPDSVGTYGFAHSYWPHMPLPMHLTREGYNTAGVGKIFHWETSDRKVWSYDNWDNNWYDYQGRENGWMNSSTMPDKVKPEEKFRDYEFTMRALSTWKKMIKEPKPWMLALGYKLPHLAIHVPHKYYEMYKGVEKTNSWHLSKKELRYPVTSHEISYRCCADSHFHYMREEGAKPSNRSVRIGDINMVLPDDAHDEMMQGYCAGVTFVDKMLGLLLDFMDNNNLWSNTMVVLTSDHGMHNGEKGIWEKWTLFEEATRVPLFIHHPKTPFAGQHYKFPVESIDVYATINDLLRLPEPREKLCRDVKCKPLQGKSLGPVVLGQTLYSQFGSGQAGSTGGNVLSQIRTFLTGGGAPASGASSPQATSSSGEVMPVLEHNFAISQAVRCAPFDRVKDHIPYRFRAKSTEGSHKGIVRDHYWNDCDVNDKRRDKEDFTTLGYSMRTPEYRYTVYFYYNRTTQYPELDRAPFEEELYDHKNETLQDFTHRETYNLAVKPVYGPIMDNLRQKLIRFIREKIKFGDH